MATLELEPETSADETPTITFLNRLGDVTIIWDKAEDEAVKKLIAKKIKEGISFFIIKKKSILRRRSKVKDTNDITERRVDVKDKDLNELLKTNKSLELVEVVNGETFEFVKRSTDPEEISKKQSVALAPVVGG